MKREANEQSMLKILTNNLENGALDPSFRLPEEETDAAFKDPSAFLPVTDEQLAAVNEALQDASTGYITGAADTIRKLSLELPAAAGKDDLQKIIQDAQDSVDMGMLVRLGLDLFTGSETKEAVKYGLCIIELFSADNMPTPLKDLIRISAMYEDFTPFAVPIIQRWNYSDVILSGLKKIVNDNAAVIITEMMEADREEA